MNHGSAASTTRATPPSTPPSAESASRRRQYRPADDETAWPEMYALAA